MIDRYEREREKTIKHGGVSLPDGMGSAADRDHRRFPDHQLACAVATGVVGMPVLEILGNLLSRMRRNEIAARAFSRRFSAVSLVSPSGDVCGIDVCMVHAQPHSGEAACSSDKRDEV